MSDCLYNYWEIKKCEENSIVSMLDHIDALQKQTAEYQRILLPIAAMLGLVLSYLLGAWGNYPKMSDGESNLYAVSLMIIITSLLSLGWSFVCLLWSVNPVSVSKESEKTKRFKYSSELIIITASEWKELIEERIMLNARWILNAKSWIVLAVLPPCALASLYLIVAAGSVAKLFISG